MKINGKKIGTPKPRIEVFHRGEGEDIEYFPFTIIAVTDYKEFDAVCSKPAPAMRQVPGEPPTAIIDDDFEKAMRKYFQLRADWTFLKGISETPNLQWERVTMNDPDTWHLWLDELSECGFTNGEVRHLQTKVAEMNLVDEKRMVEARESFFLSTRQSPEESSSEKVAATAT